MDQLYVKVVMQGRASLVVINKTWKVSYIKESSIIWRQKFPVQRNGGVKIGIVVENIDTRNTFAGATKAKKSENVLHM